MKVIADKSHPGRWLEHLPIARDQPLLALFLTLALVAMAFVVRMTADGILPVGIPYVTFFPAILVSSLLFGARYGSVAALLSGLLAWYFFLPPVHSFGLGYGSGVALAFFIFVAATDVAMIHWMQRAVQGLAAERERSQTLAETRELLFRELQHRVSNNLQVVSGLLTLQKRHVADEGARAALDAASQRLAVIGRISRQLYRLDGEPHDMRTFLQPLCADVLEAGGRADLHLDLRVAEEIALAPDAAVPLALIVAETVANAIEHGFEGRDGGRIEVELGRTDEGGLMVEVRDDGRGLPDGFRVEDSRSLGLRIALMLAGQLGGRFELAPGKGATARLILPPERVLA